MLTPRVAFGGAIALSAVWIVLAIVIAVPSGWVHLFLAVGATLIAVGIVRTDGRTDGQTSTTRRSDV